MLVIENATHAAHSPHWKFILGKEEFSTREVPQRVASIISELKKDPSFVFEQAESHPVGTIKKLHPYHDVLKGIADGLADPTAEIYPDIFPGEGARFSKNLRLSPLWLGRICTDAVTPVMKATYAAAKGSADVALTGANKLLQGEQFVYSLCRPPGHHAGPRVFGGYCYFNNVGIAAEKLSSKGKVVILDIDYHHGNGTQELFENRSDIFTISIHGDPIFEYPYYSGFASERGLGKGRGTNLNLILTQYAEEAQYLKKLEKAVAAIKKFKPKFLVIAAGFDAYEKDPVGQAKLTLESYHKIGLELAKLRLPTLLCQEGGYNVEDLGKCVHSLLRAF